MNKTRILIKDANINSAAAQKNYLYALVIIVCRYGKNKGTFPVLLPQSPREIMQCDLASQIKSIIWVMIS